MSNLTVEERIELIKSIADGGEIVGLDELKDLLESGQDLITYDGFEPSGQMHIAQGIQRAINVNKMVDAGFTFKMLVADWFGYINNKMGGDINKIQTVGKYFIEIWRASGMNLDGVEFVWTSDMVKDPSYWELVLKVAKANSLKRVLKTTQIMGRSESDDLSAAQIFYPCMQTADVFLLGAQVTELGMDQRKANMLARDVAHDIGYKKPIVLSHHMLQGLGVPKEELTLKFISIGLNPESKYKTKELTGYDPLSELMVNESGSVNVGRFFIEITPIPGDDLKIKILVRDNDSKKENTIELSKNNFPSEKVTGIKFKNIESHKDFFIIGLEYDNRDPKDRAIDIKMSKSIPDTAIFMTDSPEDVKRKISKAYCMDGQVEENPILEYCKYIIFAAKYLKGQEDLLSNGFVVERPEKWGGNIVFKSYEELESAFSKTELSSIDLKAAVIGYLNKLLQPVRDHFENDANAKAILEQVKSFQVTR